MGEMTRHVPDAGSYAPVTILIQELPDSGTRLAYDSVASDIAIYDNPAATTGRRKSQHRSANPVAPSVWLVALTRCPEPARLRGPEALAFYESAPSPGRRCSLDFHSGASPSSPSELHPRLDADLGENIAKVAVNSVRCTNR